MKLFKKLLLKIKYPFLVVKWKLFGKPDAVRVLVVYRDKILLLRKSYKRDGWYMPGGFIDTHETPKEAALREIREELGIHVSRALSAHEIGFVPTIDQFDLFTYVVNLDTMDVRIDDVEIEQAQWFSLDTLPKDGEGPTAHELLHVYYRSKEQNHEHD